MLVQLGVSIVSDSSSNAIAFRQKYGIPAGTSADVVRVEDDSVCEAATAAIEAIGAPQQSEAFVVVRLGSTNPFYLTAKRVSLAPLYGIYVFDSQFKLLTIFR
jgi:hypothetical protein